jgi:hypothetical protein
MHRIYPVLDKLAMVVAVALMVFGVIAFVGGVALLIHSADADQATPPTGCVGLGTFTANNLTSFNASSGCLVKDSSIPGPAARAAVSVSAYGIAGGI